MKKIISILIVLISISSCQEEVKFNNPSFQAQKDDVFWRAIDSKATLSGTGMLTIQGFTEHEVVTLTSVSKNVGTYILGTTTFANSASYIYSENSSYNEYETIIVPGTVNKIVLSNGGSGYSTATSVITTGGSGFGLKVNIVANTSGVVTEVKVNSPGNNYKAGDIITINRADVIGNAKFLVQNVSKSNGEIKITEYDGATVSGTFKFNAPLVDGGSNDPEVLNYQYGVFYKVPVIPAP